MVFGQGQGHLRVSRAGHWGLEGKAATWRRQGLGSAKFDRHTVAPRIDVYRCVSVSFGIYIYTESTPVKSHAETVGSVPISGAARAETERPEGHKTKVLLSVAGKTIACALDVEDMGTRDTGRTREEDGMGEMVKNDLDLKVIQTIKFKALSSFFF